MFFNVNVNRTNSNRNPADWWSALNITLNDQTGFFRISYREQPSVYQAFDDLIDTLINQPRDAEFWMAHPLMRGIGTGLMTKIFNRAIGSPAAFRMGFMYGAFSGVVNAAERPIMEKFAQIKNPALKVTTLTMLSTLPWVVSYHIMQKCLAKSGRSFFHITTGPAVGTAVAIHFFGWAHADLYQKK